VPPVVKTFGKNIKPDDLDSLILRLKELKAKRETIHYEMNEGYQAAVDRDIELTETKINYLTNNDRVKVNEKRVNDPSSQPAKETDPPIKYTEELTESKTENKPAIVIKPPRRKPKKRATRDKHEQEPAIVITKKQMLIDLQNANKREKTATPLRKKSFWKRFIGAILKRKTTFSIIVGVVSLFILFIFFFSGGYSNSSHPNNASVLSTQPENPQPPPPTPAPELIIVSDIVGGNSANHYPSFKITNNQDKTVELKVDYTRASNWFSNKERSITIILKPHSTEQVTDPDSCNMGACSITNIRYKEI